MCLETPLVIRVSLVRLRQIRLFLNLYARLLTVLNVKGLAMRFSTALRLAICLMTISVSQVSRAEFPGIEGRCREVADDLAAKLAGKRTVVCVRAVDRFQWKVHEAICLELTASLRALSVDAVRSARVEGLAELSDSSQPFSPREFAEFRQAGFQAILTGHLRQGPQSTAILELRVHQGVRTTVRGCRKSDGLEVCVQSGNGEPPNGIHSINGLGRR